MPRPKTDPKERERGAALGEELQRRRSEAKRSAEHLAVEASVSVETVRSIERGRIVNPGVFTVAAIASALGVTIQTLVDAASEKAAR